MSAGPSEYQPSATYHFIDLGHVSGGAGHIAGHPDRVERQI